MFKLMLIKWAADMIFDEVVKGAEKASRRSSNKLDNKIVKVVKESKEDILRAVKQK